MEQLVVTLAYANPSRDAEMLTRIRLIADTMRNAPGLMSSRFYRGRESEPYYLMLTTWADEESWQQAEPRYSPKLLLLSTGTDMLSATPEQWQMRYLWGYSRPSAPPMLAAIHLATIRPDQADMAQRGWVEGSRRLAVHPTLAFAFLARGSQDEGRPQHASPSPSDSNPEHPVFLHLLSWANEIDREALYADPNYQAVLRFMSSIGTLRQLPLEPM